MIEEKDIRDIITLIDAGARAIATSNKLLDASGILGRASQLVSILEQYAVSQREQIDRPAQSKKK